MKEIEIRYDIVLSAMFDYSYINKYSTARIYTIVYVCTYAYSCMPARLFLIRTIMSI